MDRDRMNHLDPGTVAIAALNNLDRVSDNDKEVQAVALAVTLLAYSRRHGADTGDLFTVANNMLASKHVKHPSFEALRLYVRHEL